MDPVSDRHTEGVLAQSGCASTSREQLPEVVWGRTVQNIHIVFRLLVDNRYLSYEDLLACQLLDRKIAKAIQTDNLVSRAYWNQFPRPCVKSALSVQRYLNEIRQWFLTCGKTKAVLRLDKLLEHPDFHKVLLYVISKTLEHAQSWGFVEKLSLDYGETNRFPLSVFSPDGISLVVGSIDDWVYKASSIQLYTYDLTGALNWKLRFNPGEYRFAQYSSDGKSVVFPYSDRIHILNYDAEEDKWYIKQSIGGRYCFACFSSDGQNLLTINSNSEIHILTHDGVRYDVLLSQKVGDRHPLCDYAAFSADSCSLFVFRTSNPEECTVYDKNRQGQWGLTCRFKIESSGEYKRHESDCFRVSPDGLTVAKAVDDRVYILSRTEDHNWKGQYCSDSLSGQVMSICFSPDSHKLVALFDVAHRTSDCVFEYGKRAGWEKKRLHTKVGEVYGGQAIFSPNSRCFILTSYDIGGFVVFIRDKMIPRWVRKYEINFTPPMDVYLGSNKLFQPVQFTPDGRKLLLASRQSIYVMDIVALKPSERRCAIL
ncbi:WD40 repeat domain-containing protein [Kistimonas asteriae]|uniref:WD40 repeat domain-containing protein n=1 Tax=Kistimonas asteriae TaxID=517724 RepID=UPI001BA769FC|nr:WD40 repeat domain-containing protein [Kistimonas asteriae]